MDTSVMQQKKIGLVAKNSDILVSVGVIAVLVIMILPLPTWMLDVLLSCSITVSIIVLLHRRCP